MKLTAEMKKYIRRLITEKAKAAAEPIRREIERIEKRYGESVRLVQDKQNSILEDAGKKLCAFAKSKGLTFINHNPGYLRGLISESDFCESNHTTVYLDSGYNEPIHIHDNNPKLLALESKVKHIYSRIDSECGRVMFNIEVGGDRGRIEDMIASIKF